MKRLSHAAELPFSAERILDLVTREDYYHFRFGGTPHIESAIELLADDDALFECRITREADTAKLPGMARKLLGHRIHFVQLYRWHRVGEPYAGELEMTVSGANGRIHSDLILTPDAATRCRYEARTQIEARVPLIGGQIERLLAGHADETFDQSIAAMQSYANSHA